METAKCESLKKRWSVGFILERIIITIICCERQARQVLYWGLGGRRHFINMFWENNKESKRFRDEHLLCNWTWFFKEISYREFFYRLPRKLCYLYFNYFPLLFGQPILHEKKNPSKEEEKRKRPLIFIFNCRLFLIKYAELLVDLSLK